MDTETQARPKVFVSYSWIDHDHVERVAALADSLVQNGVDVVFDRYELGEDADFGTYLESALGDESIAKVLLLCDTRYKEKADSGNGLDTDPLVISRELYGRLDSAGTDRRFVPIVMEKDPSGNAPLPSYLKNRRYIDLSLGASGGFDQLIRYLHGKPVQPRPEPGTAPLRTATATPTTPATTSLRDRAIDAIYAGSPNARLLCEAFLEQFTSDLETFRLAEYNQDQLIQRIDEFLPVRDQFVDIFIAAIRGDMIARLLPAVRRFFERMYAYTEPTDSLYSWKEAMLDHFKYLMNECFLYGAAALLHYEQFSLLPEYLSDYYIHTKKKRSSELMPYVGFLFHLKSLEIENQNKQLNRFDLHCDFLRKNATRLDLRFTEVMQADFTLYLFDKLHQISTFGMGWMPRTLLYATHMTGPFEIFARATSRSYFEHFKAALSINSVQDLVGLRAMLIQEQERLRFNSEPRDLAMLANLDGLGRRP